MNTAKTSPLYYLGLCAIAKNETPFLREWVAYHYYLGFEKIYIYDNESTIPVRETVTEFYNLGVCDTYTLQGDAVQCVAYNLCLRDHGHEFEWLAFFDLDEFLCLKQDTDARVFLRDYEDYSGLALTWDMISSSGHITRPRGLVTEEFCQSTGYSVHSKCIVRPAKVTMAFTSHHFIFHEGISVNPDKEPAIGSYIPIATKKACLNHYSFRSQQDYAEKLEKGDATFGKTNPRKWELFFTQAQQTTYPRSDILPAAHAVRQMLEQGALHRKNDITLADTNGTTLPQLLAYSAQLIKLGHDGIAEVLFALCYKQFSLHTEFVRFGAALCLRLGKTDRAFELAQTCLTLCPDEESYYLLLECFLAGTHTTKAARLADFLLYVARIKENKALEERLYSLTKRYSLELASQTP